MQRGVGNVNAMKMAKCIKELERIYNFKEGRPSDNKLRNNFAISNQNELAERVGLDVRQLQNYKKLNELIPELQSLVEVGDLKSTTAYKIYKGFWSQIILFTKIFIKRKIYLNVEY